MTDQNRAAERTRPTYTSPMAAYLGWPSTPETEEANIRFELARGRVERASAQLAAVKDKKK